MSEQYPEISAALKAFIERQQMFFVGTAAPDGRVNISPKGMDSLRVTDRKQVVWLNLTGSGNETAAHLVENPRMTLMFASFELRPLILRIYGQARTLHPQDDEWPSLISQFDELPGARQIFVMSVDLVQTSCGFAVPRYEFVEQRPTLVDWASNKGDELPEYWKEKNQWSIDGKPTFILPSKD